jgi:alcohol dehydrogenase class IV
LRKKSDNEAALNKYTLMGKLFIDEKGEKENYYIDAFIQYLHELANDLHLTDFKKYGLNEKNVELICKRTENKNNPVKLALEDLMEILTRLL